MSELNYNQAAQLVQDVLDGNQDPLEAFGLLKRLQDNIDRCIAEIKPDALSEAEKDKNKTYPLFKTEFRNGKRTWDFDTVPLIVDMENKLKAIKAVYKSAYEQSQKGMQTVDQDGVLLDLPTCKHGEDTISVKLLN
jgi:hypothetical protein